jgi:hypothetical protein
MKEHAYDKYVQDDTQFSYHDSTSKSLGLIKQESEFFNEEDYIPGQLIRVKRIAKSNNEDWQILVNGQKTLLLKGSRFSGTEKQFLRTAEGLSFIINGVKQGWVSVSEFKRQIQTYV